MFHVKKLAEDCKYLQSDIDLAQEQCIENDMKINMHKPVSFILYAKLTLFSLLQ